MRDSMTPSRRRRWPAVLPFALIVAAAALWSGGWFYLAGQADRAIADWRAQEAGAGRVYACGTQSIGGFPFRIEVRCSDPTAELSAMAPPVALRAADTLFAWQVYQPALLLAEVTGPLAIGEPRKPAAFNANWRLAQASIRGTLSGLERVSVVVDDPTLARVGDSHAEIFKARHLELHGRPAANATPEHPAVDLALRLAAGSAPTLHPLTVEPLDADMTAVLHGLPDLAPQPWPALLRQWQARGGSIEITKARVEQGDVIAVGAGTLALTEHGGLDGRLQLTIVGLEQVLQALDVDRAVSQGDIGTALNALNRFMPGLGDMARRNAGASIVAGLGALGQGTTLEGKPAVSVPLRFDDGAIWLGPIQIGRAPPLF
jgi:hypothetical protein